MLDLKESYNRISKQYAEKLFHELDAKEIDRNLLDNFANLLTKDSHICELGCGPGQIASYLFAKGFKLTGLDISPGMISEAQRLNPEIHFRVANMLDMPNKDACYDAVVAFYSLIHIPMDKWTLALAQIERSLKADGLFLFSFHIGSETIHLDEWWGEEVQVDSYFFEVEQIEKIIQKTNFEIINITQRAPYPEDIEYQSKRAYFLVKKLSGTS